jgi:hypothetical protein
MPRQTASKEYIFPDGFQFAVNVGDGFEDVGLVAGGATGTLTWDEMRLDGGNYLNVIKKAKNFRFQLSPSAIWNWDLSIFNKLFGGGTEMSTGDLVNKPDHVVDLVSQSYRLTHFDGQDARTLIADNITALDTDTVNDYITVPKSVFTTSLAWTTAIDGLVNIEGKHEVHVSDKNTAGATGHFYTDATNLYFIVANGTYADLAGAKTALTGTKVVAFNSIDWQFTLYNATVDSGASFSFKGVNEDGVNELTVSFTAEPDEEEGNRLFKLFIA